MIICLFISCILCFLFFCYFVISPLILSKFVFFLFMFWFVFLVIVYSLLCRNSILFVFCCCFSEIVCGFRSTDFLQMCCWLLYICSIVWNIGDKCCYTPLKSYVLFFICFLFFIGYLVCFFLLCFVLALPKKKVFFCLFKMTIQVLFLVIFFLFMFVSVMRQCKTISMTLQ